MLLFTVDFVQKGTQIKNPGGKAIRFSERRALARRVRHIFWDARQISMAKNAEY